MLNLKVCLNRNDKKKDNICHTYTYTGTVHSEDN